MKIAFASCFDALDDEIQPVWDRVRGLKPDVLLLLGDSVYMDFGVLGNRPLGWPRKATDEEFARTLHSRYAAQWGVESFRRLVSSGIRIGAIWDDHDFAWNNTCGAGTAKRTAVSREKRLISKALFLQFRKTLRTSKKADYPAMPPMATLLQTPDEGIQESFDIGDVRFVMLDGRSFREDPNDAPNAEMHGRLQRAWAGKLLSEWDGLCVVGAGSVLTHSKECWEDYIDYEWLLGLPAERVVVLTGDIHKNVAPQRHREKPSPLYEITSSGAARPGILGSLIGGAWGNFGILNTDVNSFVTLYSKEHPEGANYSIAF